MSTVQESLHDVLGVLCGHQGCYRPAVRVVAYETPRHREFFGQTHDCCAVHSRPSRDAWADAAGSRRLIKTVEVGGRL